MRGHPDRAGRRDHPLPLVHLHRVRVLARPALRPGPRRSRTRCISCTVAPAASRARRFPTAGRRAPSSARATSSGRRTASSPRRRPNAEDGRERRGRHRQALREPRDGRSADLPGPAASGRSVREVASHTAIGNARALQEGSGDGRRKNMGQLEMPKGKKIAVKPRSGLRRSEPVAGRVQHALARR